jgi:hypothetical protein
MALLPEMLRLPARYDQPCTSGSASSSARFAGTTVPPQGSSSSHPGRQSTDMDTQLHSLRLRLANACSTRQPAVAEAAEAGAAAHVMGPAVSALFDLLVALRPAGLLQAAQQAPQGVHHPGSQTSSSSSLPAARGPRQETCKKRAWDLWVCPWLRVGGLEGVRGAGVVLSRSIITQLM